MALQGKVALVTGGARGIGRGVVQTLLARGACVAAVSRSAEDVAATARELGDLGELLVRSCDVSDEEAVTGLVDEVVERFGGLDALVCSHGIYKGLYSVLDYPTELWDETVGVNLRAGFLCGRAAARAMVAAGVPGRIVFISSTAGMQSVEHECAYDASKGGLHALTRAMAVDLARHGITVNSVAPGWINTGMIRQEVLEEYEPVINPMRRFGEAKDIADAVAWLVDPETSYVTGSTVVVDGGQSAALGFANLH